MGCLIDHEYRWVPYIKKNGQPSRSRIWGHWELDPYCPLNRCELCGLLASYKRVQYRHTPIYDTDEKYPNFYNLCMACWNRARAIDKRVKEVEECQRLIRKLKEVIRVQDPHNRRAARLPRDHDGRREERPTGGGQGEPDHQAGCADHREHVR